MMTKKIPKIIHQIWSGVDEPLPSHLKALGETWRDNHKEWEYIIWDNQMMLDFITHYYPQYWNAYNNFEYNIQRWDAIRYLILDKIGGVYTDFDSECIKPIDQLLENKTCCFSQEPVEQGFIIFNKEFFFNNAFMAAVPDHPFIKLVIKQVFENIKIDKISELKKGEKVQLTTGPLMLVNLYENYASKDDIYIIPPEYTSPFTRNDTIDYMNGRNLDVLERKLEKAYSVHYFFNDWMRTIN